MVALLYLDLDKFKPVNDQFGHAAGDFVLREIGARLRARIREEDTAARLGGDEFGLIVMESDAAHVRDLLARVTTAVNHALPGLVVTMSSGTALGPADGSDPAGLYRLADERLYRSKRG